MDVKQQKEMVWPELVEDVKKSGRLPDAEILYFQQYGHLALYVHREDIQKRTEKRAEKLLHTHAEGLYEYHAAKTASVNT